MKIETLMTEDKQQFIKEERGRKEGKEERKKEGIINLRFATHYTVN